MRRAFVVGCLYLAQLNPFPAYASLDTIGPNGINSAGLARFDGVPLERVFK